MSARTHIGTSGFHYAHWIGNFYPAKTPGSRMLEHYIEHFDTVEINNSFYHLPARETFKNWKEATPKDFVFAVKASRFLTHNKKLNDPKEPMKNILQAARGLGKKLGPLLVQLPPNWRVNLDRLEAFLKIVPKSIQCTIEFREHSWLCEEVYHLLRKYNVAFCIYDLAGFETPHLVTANFAYIRLHGSTPFKYLGSYSDRALRKWAREIESWSAKLTDVYVYFDNDPFGDAPRNAQTLKRMIEG